MKTSFKNLFFLLKFGMQKYTQKIHIPVTPGNHSKLHKNTELLSITYIGQATCLIQIQGVNILTDPNWAKTLFFCKRYSKPGISIDDLPRIDVILLSHAHFDHLHYPSLNKICNEETIIICEKTVAPLLKTVRANIQSTTIGETITAAGLQFHLVPVKHNGDRYIWDTFRKCTGFVIEGETTIFFPGDTAYTADFKVTGDTFQPDISLMPIGDFKPRYINKHTHIHPSEIPQALEDLQTKLIIPIHWGTFQFSDDKLREPIDQVIHHLDKRNMLSILHILEHGETWWKV